MRPALVAVAFCLYVGGARADFHPIAIFSAISDPDVPGTAIVVDLDETVLSPVGFHGSEAWYETVYADLRARGRGIAEAHVEATRIWNAAQSGLPMRLLDPGFVRWMGERKAKGIRIFALTARRGEIAEATLGQLASVGVSFAGAIPDFRFAGPRGFRSVGGVLFAGETNEKGRVLARLLDRYSIPLSRVVFVDNRRDHLASVEAWMRRRGIATATYLFIPGGCEGLASAAD